MRTRTVRRRPSEPLAVRVQAAPDALSLAEIEAWADQYIAYILERPSSPPLQRPGAA